MKLKTDRNRIYASSDLHLYHKNICSGATGWSNPNGCRRFPDLNAMNYEIMQPFLDLEKDDLLILIGDTLFGEKNYDDFFGALKCQIFYVFGNHCNPNKFYNNKHYPYPNLAFSGNILRLNIDNKDVIFCHYPLMSWEDMDRTIMIHGHTHGTLEYPENFHDRLHKGHNPFIFDAGIDKYYALYGKYKPFMMSHILHMAKIHRNGN